MSAQTLTLSHRGKWIISRSDDLLFFSGSAVFGYLLVIVGLSMGKLPVLLTICLALMLDGPHVYSTATRALFDSEERKRVGLVWLILLPLCLSSAVVSWAIGFQTFFLFVAAWSHFHISKQHMGFVMIYRRKAQERERLKFDKYFTLVSLILPFLFYLSAVFSGSTKLLPVFFAPAVVMAGLYITSQMRLPDRNWPKLLVLFGFIPLQWLAWWYAAIDPYSLARLLAAGLMTNVGHSLQYLRLMWFHNSNRYAGRNGLVGLVGRKWIYFFAAAVLLALPNFLIGRQLSLSFWPPFMLGFLMFHFVLDAKLWRIRGDKELAEALHL